MGSFAADTAVAGENGHYTGEFSAAWDVWGPMGGYKAALAMRAMGAETDLTRPATFTCQFVGTGKPGPVEIHVDTVRRTKRTHALRCTMTQDGSPILAATTWIITDDMPGLDHADATMPDVSSVEETPTFKERAEQRGDDYADWYPFWANVQGKPCRWQDFERGSAPPAQPPIWEAWMRLNDNSGLEDPFVEAGRILMWLDLCPWNAVQPAHSFQGQFLAPNIDLTAQFHCLAPDVEWMLSDGYAPCGQDGLAGCLCKVWTSDGRLAASGTSQMVWRPNPNPWNNAE